MITFLFGFILGVSLLFAMYILAKSTGENLIRNVAAAAAVMVIWPILAVIYVIAEIFDLFGGDYDRDDE